MFRWSPISIILSMVIIPSLTAFKFIKSSNEELIIFGESISYDRFRDENIIVYNDKEYVIDDYESIVNLSYIIDCLEKNTLSNIVIFTELIFIFLLVTAILLYFVFVHLEKLFVNIYSEGTLFTFENIKHIKFIAKLMIAIIIIPNVGGMITEFIIKQDLDLGFELFCYSIV